MTQTHIIQTNKSGVNMPALAASISKMIHGSVKADGEFDKQILSWYVQIQSPWRYRIVHNLGRIDYGVSVASPEASIETSNLTATSFDVEVRKNGELVSAPFTFALNFVQKV